MLVALFALPLMVADATPFEEQSGITLEQAGDDLRVAQVAQGSAAADAGFEVGDIIVHVDGKRPAEFDASKPVHHVLVRHDGKTKLRKLRLKKSS